MANLSQPQRGGLRNTPKSVADAFSRFDQNISIDLAERQAAESRHREVEEIIMAAGLGDSTFMQGSFARKTMRKPLKDVDVVILLPQRMAKQWKTPAGAVGVHELFRKPLLDHYGSRVGFDETAQAGKALQLSFTDVEFTIDLVAAFAVPNSEWIEIADRHEGRWVLSNTQALLRVVRERNLHTNGQFIHHVRMVKEMKAHHAELDKVCGLVIESLTFAAVTGVMPHSRAVAATVSHAAAAVLGAVLDPTGVDDLSAKWTQKERRTYAQVFAAAATRAEEALRLERNGQITPAIEVWSDVLGADFPLAAPQSSSDAIAALVSGSVTSTGRAIASASGAVRTRPTRAWRLT